MKIYYKNGGSGSLLVRGVDGKRITIRPGVNTVPDDVGADLIAKYPKVITGDEEAQAAKANSVKVTDENAALKAENKELKDQVAKLQLIAAQVPVASVKDSAKDKRIAELEKQLAEFEKLTAPDA